MNSATIRISTAKVIDSASCIQRPGRQRQDEQDDNADHAQRQTPPRANQPHTSRAEGRLVAE